jgi:hypothetical protein
MNRVGHTGVDGRVPHSSPRPENNNWKPGPPPGFLFGKSPDRRVPGLRSSSNSEELNQWPGGRGRDDKTSYENSDAPPNPG